MSRCKVNRFVAVARVLACGLAGVILLFELLATNSAFHQTLHQSGETGAHSCVLCLMANGQADLSESTTVAPTPVQASFDLAPRLESVVLVDFTYLLSVSRAPPAATPLQSVLA